MRCVLCVLFVACGGTSSASTSPRLGGSADAARPRCDRASSAAHPSNVDCTITVVEAFADLACVCKDAACVDKVNADMTRWATDLTTNTQKAAEPSGEQAKQLTAAMDRYTACATKVPSSDGGADPCGD